MVMCAVVLEPEAEEGRILGLKRLRAAWAVENLSLQNQINNDHHYHPQGSKEHIKKLKQCAL